MKTSISKYSLWLATLTLLVIMVFGTYEYYYNMPDWFADPPASFETIRQQAAASQRFWIPVQILFFVSFITALITNRKYVNVRKYLVYAGIAYLLVVISTAAYFAPEVIGFMDIPVTAPKTDELINKVSVWNRTTAIRNVLQLISLIFVVIANYKKSNLGNPTQEIDKPKG